MKKTVVIGLILVLVLAMTGCGSKPETAVDKFFSAVKTFDSEAMTKTLAPSATDNLGLASDYLNETVDPIAEPFVDYLKDNAKKITYEVTGTKVDGDEATVTVKCKYVDGSPLFTKIVEELFPKIMAAALSGKELTEEDMTQMGVEVLKDNIATATETFTEKTIDIPCVKIDGDWYVKLVGPELVDVVSSNLFTAAKGLADSFGE